MPGNIPRRIDSATASADLLDLSSASRSARSYWGNMSTSCSSAAASSSGDMGTEQYKEPPPERGISLLLSLLLLLLRVPRLLRLAGTGGVDVDIIVASPAHLDLTAPSEESRQPALLFLGRISIVRFDDVRLPAHHLERERGHRQPRREDALRGEAEEGLLSRVQLRIVVGRRLPLLIRLLRRMSRVVRRGSRGGRVRRGVRTRSLWRLVHARDDRRPAQWALRDGQ